MHDGRTLRAFDIPRGPREDPGDGLPTRRYWVTLAALWLLLACSSSILC